MLNKDDFSITFISPKSGVTVPGVSGTTSKFVTRYETAYEFPGNYKMAVFSASVWNTNKNITSALGNRTIEFSNDDGSTWVTLTIEPGTYTPTSLNKVFSDFLLEYGYVMENGLTPLFSIEPDEATARLYLVFQHSGPVLTKAWTCRMRVPSSSILNRILGVDNNHVYGGESTPSTGALRFLAPYTADFANGVTSFLIRTNITKSTYGSDQNATVLLPLKITAGVNYQINYISPGVLLWQDCTLSNTTTNSIAIEITDNLGRTLELSDTDQNEIIILFKKVT